MGFTRAFIRSAIDRSAESGTDRRSLLRAFGRPPGEVLNIVHLNLGTVSKGGFFPEGVNGAIRGSGGSPSGGPATGAGGTADETDSSTHDTAPTSGSEHQRCRSTAPGQK